LRGVDNIEVHQTLIRHTVRPSSKSVSRVTNEPFSQPVPQNLDFPPDLAAVYDAWPTLPEALKAGILAMVKAARAKHEAR
jgi:hypothetical protein